MSRRKERQSPLVRFLFLVYCGVMLWLLFGRSYGWIEGLSYEQMLRQNINLTPFLTIKNYWRVIYHRTNEAMIYHCFINLFGNVILFIPAGWLLPKIWQKMHNFFRFFFTCALCIFLVELMQLFSLLGSFDIDDLILNLFGMTLGFVYYHISTPKHKKR